MKTVTVVRTLVCGPREGASWLEDKRVHDYAVPRIGQITRFAAYIETVVDVEHSRVLPWRT